MPSIKPIHQATRADITALAHAAAELNEPSEQANPFAAGTPNHRAFTVDYFQHMLILESENA